MTNQRYCIDCGGQVKKTTAKRCATCAGLRWKTVQQNRNYPSCPDCGIKLKHYRSKKCHRCAQLGYVPSEETKAKLRAANLGKKPTPETCEKIRLASTGRTHTEEVRKLLSEQKKGKEFTVEHKAKLSAARKNNPNVMGERNPAWKGGVTPKTRILRHSTEYVNWRTMVFTRDNFICQDCGETYTYLEAHHIKSWADYPELRFDVENGVTLCKPCHIKTRSSVAA